MTRRSPVALLALFLIAPLLAQEKPAERVVLDQWVTLSRKGTKLGWMHETVTAVSGPGGERYVTRSESESVTNREGDESSKQSFEREEETAEGWLVSFEERELSSGMETITKGEVKGDKMIVDLTTAGETRRQELAWPGEVLGTWGAYRLAREKGFAPGTQYTYRSFSEDALVVSDVTNRVIGKETVTMHGGPRDLHKIEQTDTLLPGFLIHLWADDEGIVRRMHVPRMGDMRGEEVPQEVATAKPEGPLRDIIAESNAACNIAIPHSQRIEAATYRIRPREGAMQPVDWPETWQKVVEKGDAGVTLRVESVTPAQSGSIPVADPAMKDFLSANSWLQSDDATIGAKAREAVGDEKDAWKAGKRLERWVYENIGKKNYKVSFATAKEVMQTLEGDCTEHAVLLAAMARAVGLPSRIAAGLVYHQGGFGGHMWIEISVAGQWVPLDATFPCARVDATHITLAVSSLQTETPGKAMMALAGLMGEIAVDVQRFTLAGREVVVGPDFRDSEIAGDRWTHVYLGLTVNKPAGWSFRQPSAEERKKFLVAVLAPAGTAGVAVKGDAADYAFDLAQVKEMFAGVALQEDVGWEIQGRKAWRCRFVHPETGVVCRLAFVHDGDTAYSLSMNGGGWGDVKGWEAILAGVSFAAEPGK